MDKAFIYFCNAGEESYFFDNYKRTLSAKALRSLRASDVTSTTAQLFYQYTF